MSRQATKWEIKPLGDVCNVIGGGTPSKKNEAFYQGDIPWASVRDMNVDVITSTEFRITEEAVKKSSTNVISAGNVVIATRVGLGKICLINQDTAINQDLRGIIPKHSKHLERRFLFWWFKSISHLIEKEGTGATVKGVKLPFVKSLPLPLPPLPEQQRIVAILDDAFERIDAAIANTEKNLANALELFESYLNDVFVRKGDGWEEKKLSSLCHKITVGHVGSMASKYIPDGIPFLRSQNVKPFMIDLENVKYIDTAFHESLKKSSLSPGDVAVVRTGYPGTAAVIPDHLPIGNCSDLVIARPKDLLSPHFLAAFFNSPFGKKVVGVNLVGAAQKHFNVTAAKNVSLPFPPMQRQLEIVYEIERLAEKVSEVESIYINKRTALTELKQSILQKAFSGELTADMNQEALVN